MTTAEYLEKKGFMKGMRIGILCILESRFGTIPALVETLLDKVKSEEIFDQIIRLAVTVETLDNFIEHLSYEVSQE